MGEDPSIVELMEDEEIVSVSLRISEIKQIYIRLERHADRSLSLADGPDPMHPGEAHSLRVEASRSKDLMRNLHAQVGDLW